MGVSSAQGSAGLKPGVCTSTTRPSNPYEGQMIYETDTDMVAIWNGTAWRYIAATTPTNGTVLQVVSTTTTTPTINNTVTYADATNLTVSITPKSSTSKVLVECAVGTGHSEATGGFLRLVRDATVIGTDPMVWFYTGSTNSAYSGVTNSIIYLDSPATTSATVYKIQLRAEGVNGVTINRSYANAAGQTMVSSIKVTEIAG